MSKNKIFIVLMAMLMVFSSISVVLAAGSSSSENGKPFPKANDQSEYQDNDDPLKYSNGKYSSWDKQDKALVVDEEYSNKLVYKKGSSQDVQLIGTSANGPRSFKAGNEYNTSSKKWDRDAVRPALDDLDMYHSINLKGKDNGDVSFLYRNYHYLNPETKKWENVDIKVTVNSFNHVRAETSRYNALKNNSEATPGDIGFQYQYEETDPILFISKRCYGGFPRIDMFNIGDLQLKTEFFKAGTTTPINIKSNVTYADIDGWQCMSFRTSTTDYTYAASNTRLLYTRDQSSAGYWYATFSDPIGGNIEGYDPAYAARHAVSFAYNGDRFYTVYGSGQQKGKATKEGNGWKVEPDHNPGHASGRDSFFGTSQYSMVIPKPSAPQKFVMDKDEPTRGAEDKDYDVISKYSEENYLPTKNELEKTIESFRYVVAQQVPGGMGTHDAGGFTYDTFTLEDQVDNALIIDESSIAVYRDHFGTDNGPANVTDGFNISVSGNKITASAKSSLLNDNTFYGSGRGSEVMLTFNAKINPDVDISKYLKKEIMEYVFENGADSTIRIGNHHWDHVPSNKVETHVKLPKPKKNVPIKEVSDNDDKTLTGTGAEKNVRENTIEKADDIYTYHVKHTVKDRDGKIPYANYWYFNSYQISDKVEDLLLIQDGAKVYEGSNDVTDKFDIAVSADRKNITATAKAAELAKADFYEKTYELRFNVKIDTQKYKTESDLAKWATENNKGAKGILLKWPNKATVNITDPVDTNDPNSEDGKGTWQKDTNNVYTNLWNPTKEENPGLVINKTTDPYEFQVGENIPYTITIKQTNPDAVAYLVEAEDTDLPEGFVIDKESVKAEGGTDPSATVEGERNIKIAAKYLRYGETLKVTFTGKAEKTLNGKVVPNEVIGRAWGTHENDKSTWDRDHTSVYINSPKLDITKTVEKEKDSNGETTYKTGDPILFTSVITNKNPGTFMRNIYAVDTFETKGLRFDKKSITVKYNSRTETERFVTLKEGTDYVMETYNAGEKIPIDNLGNKLGSKDIEDYEIAAATDEENKAAETEKGTGAVLPTKNEGGFIIKFLGKYRNLGYEDKTIPATEDERGKVVKYLADSLKAVEEENGINYTTDYANLNLQNKLVINYTMIVEDENISGKLKNFIKVPATENTNNDMIADDDKIPSGGDYARSDTSPKTPVLKHEKNVAEDSTEKGGLLHYTLTSENSSQENAYDVVITDGFTTGNAVMNKDVKVELNNNDITDSCTIEYVNAENEEAVADGDAENTDAKNSDNNKEEQPIGFKVTLNREFKPGEKIIIKYTATTTSEDPNHVHNETVLTAKDIDPIKDEEDVPMTIKSSPTSFTVKGQKIDYVIDYTNNSGEDWGKAVVEDEIISKNASYNKDFVVTIDGEDVTNGCKIDYSEDGYKATIDTNKPLNKGQNLKVVYSTTAADAKQVDNKPVLIDPIGNHKIEGNVVKIPPAPKHVKSVKENQHDGSEGQINELHYTLNSKNDTDSTLKNVVITDEILTNNLVYNEDVKIALNGEDVTNKVKITYVKAGDKSDVGSADFKDSTNPRFIIETGMDLAKGDEFVTTYSGKVTNKNVVHNETVLTADDFGGIRDEKIVPGPEEGVYVTVHKTSEPPSGSVVKEKDEITYILTAINTGKDTVPFTQVRDVIPKGTTYKEVHDGGAYNENGNYCEWVVKDLKTNESKQVRFTVTVNDNPPKEIWNVATYKSYPNDPGEPGNIPTEPDKRTEETVHYTDEDHDNHPLLRAVKSSEPVTGTEVGVGDKIKYIIELENYGDADAEKAVIRDYVPVGTKFVSAENEGKYSDAKTDSANDKGNGYVDWYPLTVKAGEKIKVAYTVEVTKDALKTKVVENQAFYQNDFDPEKGKDPSSTTNIVEHPISEPEKPVEEPTPPEEPQEELESDTAIEHNKAVKESVTAKDKILHYELTTNILTDVEDVIITDDVTSKNLAYNTSSIKVYYNGDDITKNVEIQAKEHSFLIKTGIDAIQDDVFKVVYEGKATDNKAVKNTSTAYGKDVEPVKSSVSIKPAKTELTHEKKKAESKPKSNSSVKTGDNTPIGIAAALLIISAIVAMILLFKRRGI